MSIANYDKGNVPIITKFFRDKGYSDIVISAILANWYAESALKSDNAQNSHMKKYGMTDAEYVKKVDDGSWVTPDKGKPFESDSIGFGFAQWTSSGRKKGLLDLSRGTLRSIADVSLQLDFAWKEINSTGYANVRKAFKSGTDIELCTRIFMTEYERPANQTESNQQKRVGYAKEFYETYFAPKEEPRKATEMEIREEIIKIASSHIGEKISSNGDIFCVVDYYGKPNKVAYCCIFAWDIYRLAGASKYFYGGNKTASCTTLMNWYKKNRPTWCTTDINMARKGDLIFYNFDSDANSEHVGLFVEKLTDKKFISIEGNTRRTALGDQSSGGYIAQRTRNTKQVLLFVHVNFDGEKNIPYPEPTRTLYKGCTKGEDVKWLQYALNDIMKADLVVDGSFGGKTDVLFRQWQETIHATDKNFAVDGRCGAGSRAKIIEQFYV